MSTMSPRRKEEEDKVMEKKYYRLSCEQREPKFIIVNCSFTSFIQLASNEEQLTEQHPIISDDPFIPNTVNGCGEQEQN